MSIRKPPAPPQTELYYWPWCPECKTPFEFDDEGPFAYCDCGTTEWGHPRPASWIRPGCPDNPVP